MTLPQLAHGGAAIQFRPYSGSPEFVEGLEGHWSRSSIEALAQQGRLCGYFSNDFRPEQEITRAEFVALLIDAFQIPLEIGEPVFEDSKNHWAKNYIYTARKHEMVNGASETAFEPDGAITREQAAAIIGRLLNLEGGSVSFIDAADISGYAVNYVAACQAAGIINGYADGRFLPQNHIVRAEAAVMAQRGIV